MTETAVATESATPERGVLSRVIGTIVSPKETFKDVAARPRVLGVLAVVLGVMITCQVLFISTDVGKQALLDQQVKSIESWTGRQVTDQMYQQMQSRLAIAPYTTAAFTLVGVPLMGAIVAGLLLGVFNALLDGKATFKHVYAVVVHSAVVLVLGQLFTTPLSYAQGEFSTATRLSVFVPMLEEESFVVRLLGSIDLVMIWWMVILSIGVGVLYKKRTGPIATTLLGLYATIALVIAAIRSF